MPSMPRTSKKNQKIADKILGKPDNQQKDTFVYRKEKPMTGINRTLDAWYNHKV